MAIYNNYSKNILGRILSKADMNFVAQTLKLISVIAKDVPCGVSRTSGGDELSLVPVVLAMYPVFRRFLSTIDCVIFYSIVRQ